MSSLHPLFHLLFLTPPSPLLSPSSSLPPSIHPTNSSMRMSCNGCRVLRKGCSDNCSIRPCLQWLKSPDSQAHATLFLAKFYGRAGLLNLINAGPHHLRPAIFRSLLYEACGRMVNPVYGSAGLLWSGNWQHCQEAVEAILRGDPVIPLSEFESQDCGFTSPSSKLCDIRHLSPTHLRRVKNRIRFKRPSAAKPLRITEELDFRKKIESAAAVESDSVSVETVEETLAAAAAEEETAEGSDLELELTLALDPWRRRRV